MLNDSLKCALTTRNTGDVQFQFDTLLHTYFKISDISQLKVKGLLGFVCHDTIAKTDIVQAADPIVTKEMDVVYHDVHGVLSVNDIQIEKHNFADVVVWNPFNDAVLDTNEYKSMICVEVGNVRHLPLAAGQSYESWQVLTCQ